jgi:ADP-heptose:LPS heptosyltransferase
MDFFNENYIMHNSFYNVGKKNERGIEYKHNRIDIRQLHAINLGFQLMPYEMDCFYRPTEECKFEIPEKKYVVIHPVSTWKSRTWDASNWMKLTKELNDMGYYVVSIGKDSSETGFFNVEKPVFNFEIEYGMNLMNKTSISDCWHIINNAHCFVTMDSGLLHLAGTTDTHIVMLGSSIQPFFRIPYRNGSQSYKTVYLRGSCGSFCASDMKHGVAEWGNIQGIPPLIGCLEKKQSFECHPPLYETVLPYILSI